MNKIINHLSVCSALLLSSCCTGVKSDVSPEEIKNDRNDFYNLINIKNVPQTEKDRDLFVFADLGSWTGYALPENEATRLAGSFVGPYMMTGRGWIARSLAEPVIRVDGKKYDLARNIQTSKYYPGKLVQEFRNEQLSFVTELCFSTARTAVIRSKVKNTGSKEVTISLQWLGGVYENSATLSATGKGVKILNNREQTLTFVSFNTAEDVRLIGKDSLLVVEKANLQLPPGSDFETVSTQTFAFDEAALNKELEQLKGLDADQILDRKSVV